MGEPRWQEPNLPRPESVANEATARMLRVPPELAGQRVDVFLSLVLRGTSRTRAKRIAKQAAFDTQGARLRPNRRLQAEQHVVLWRVPVDTAEDLDDFETVFEDDHILVINKPPGITVHPTASHYLRTVTKILESKYPGKYLRLVHRLDRDTSGILIVAKSPEADRSFKMLLEGTLALPPDRDMSIHKTYRTITWGCPKEGLIEHPMERDAGNPLRVKMRIASPGTGLHAGTRVRVLQQVAGYALVECDLLTGRQHQIRVHLSALGTPVVGDRLYGPDERLHAKGADGTLTAADLRRLEMPRQALHASSYSLPHALSFERLSLNAAMPKDMAEFWEKLVQRAEPLSAT